MDKSDVFTLLSELSRLKEEINTSALKLTDNDFFRQLQFQSLRFTCSEAGFLRIVSWLYTLYYEAGKINVDFIKDRFDNYDLDPDGVCAFHFNIVHNLRTSLQHSLNVNYDQNNSIITTSEQWLRKQCGSTTPANEQQWEKCLAVILKEAYNFLSVVKECIKQIEQDEFREVIIDEWKFRLTRYHPPHEFDELIGIVASDMGLEYTNPMLVRKKFYNEWQKNLELLHGSYNFKIEARKLIEQSLLKNPIPPITGREVIEELNIPAGPQVREILEMARNIYMMTPCSAGELLQKIRVQLSEY